MVVHLKTLLSMKDRMTFKAFSLIGAQIVIWKGWCVLYPTVVTGGFAGVGVKILLNHEENSSKITLFWGGVAKQKVLGCGTWS